MSLDVNQLLIYIFSSSNEGSTKKWMFEIAEMNVNSVVTMEKILKKRKK